MTTTDPLTGPIESIEAAYPMPGRNVEPTRELVASNPIPAAFDYASDRLDRLEHVLGNLNGVVMRAGSQLEPLLTDGTYDDPDAMTAPEDPSAKRDDRRSTIARRVTSLGERAQQLGDATDLITRRLEAILDRVEL